MSKLESIKADLSLHEKILFAAVAIMITLVGWTAANYLVVKSWLLKAGCYLWHCWQWWLSVFLLFTSTELSKD